MALAEKFSLNYFSPDARRYGDTQISRCETYWTGPETNHGAIVKGDSEACEETAAPKKICSDSTGTFLLLVREHDKVARDFGYSEKKKNPR